MQGRAAGIRSAYYTVPIPTPIRGGMSSAATITPLEQDQLCASIAATIADYRADEIQARTPDDVDRWVRQLDADVRIPILRELDHVLRRTYFSQGRVTRYLQWLRSHAPLVGPRPEEFWCSVRLLELQEPGRSQGAMLEVLRDLHEVGAARDTATTFLYLDDGVFSGNQISRNLAYWIRDDCPAEARVEIACLALHTGGQWNAIRPTGYVEAAKAKTGKAVEIGWWPEMKLENRLAYANVSDVLWPTALPDDDRVQAYADTLPNVHFRSSRSVGRLSLFSSPEGRHLLEQELLKAGARIHEIAPHLNGYQRPLGNSVLDSLGFGSMIVTHRNCPNNAPLALWVGDPWIPLFPRRTN